MHDLKKGLLSSVFLVLGIVLLGQTITYIYPDKDKRIVALSGSKSFRVQSDQKITAVAIVSAQISTNYVIINADTILIPADHESEGYHYFISLPIPIDNLSIQVEDPDAKVYLIHSGETPRIKKHDFGKLDNACNELPAVVLQSEWRAGLTPPNYSRTFQSVYNLIVHHSAGSNSSTNYTQIVRDIYIYHTQVNGWSDIGYNFLIAQDGTLYAGRDPNGGDQSKVRGAHFCGANSGTLGICLLGNYETTTPTSASLSTLEELLTYEVITQDLDPLGFHEHSLGLLHTISGHRDGCSTLCPGENTYALLPSIRESVASQQAYCFGDQVLSFEMDRVTIGLSQTLTLTNTSSGYRSYEWIIDGQLRSYEENEVSFNIPGTYDIGIIGYSTEDQDTLIERNAVRVSRLEKEPIVFPNPTTTRIITLDYRPAIDHVVIKDLNGKKHLQTSTQDADIALPGSMNAGIYLIEITTQTGEVITEKLVVE